MRVVTTLKHNREGYDHITIGIDVAPFGLPDINTKRILTLGADSMKEAYEKMEIVESVVQAFWRLEDLEYLRPEQKIIVGVEESKVKHE